ncbi:MAG: hypothetical protein KDD68_10410 [Bdellovibrionales bacterium]|nr:hypothetical protein [Bdellovibrionales bacterium]
MYLRMMWAVAAVSFLVGCKTVKIENGEIPQEYLGVAQQFVGDYQGKFNGFAGTLHMELQGNKMVLSYSNSFGDDIVDPRCESDIGNLVEIEASGSEEKPEIDGAVFEFFPNLCNTRIDGDYLYLSIDKKDGEMRIGVRLLERYDRWTECRTEWDGRSHRRICEDKVEPRYIWGRFTRPLN